MLVCIMLICLMNIKRIFADKNRLKNLFIAGTVSIVFAIGFLLPYLEQKKNDDFKMDVYNNSFYARSFWQLHTGIGAERLQRQGTTDKPTLYAGILLQTFLRRDKFRIFYVIAEIRDGIDNSNLRGSGGDRFGRRVCDMQT